MKKQFRIFLLLSIVSSLLSPIFDSRASGSVASFGEYQDSVKTHELSEHPGISLGAYIPPVDPSMGPNRLYYWQEIRTFNEIVGEFHPIIMYFGDLTSGFDDYLLNQLRDRLNPSPVPYISMDPYGASLESIANGSRDAALKADAAAAKRFGKPMLIRFAHEFNSTYMPWYGDPQLFVATWRHIHHLFAQEGVTNVQWVWSPNYRSDRPDLPNSDYNLYYPGDAYVDWISVNGFNWGWDDPGWSDFEYLFHDFLIDTACRYRKPQMIGLTGSVDGPGSKAEWIAHTHQVLQGYPNLRSTVWYNDFAFGDQNSADFRITVTSQYGDKPAPLSDFTDAYKAAIDDPIFLKSMPDYDQIEPPSRVCFTVDATQSTLIMGLGESTSVRINFEHAPVFSEVVEVGLVNSPPGLSHTPETISPGSGSTYVDLEIHAAKNMVPGTYPLTVQAQGGGLVQTTALTIGVVPQVFRLYLPHATNTDQK
jgi:hypothetical protein